MNKKIFILIILLIAILVLSGCYPTCDNLKPPPRPEALIDQVEVGGSLLASLPDGGALVAGCDHLWFYDQNLEMRAEAAPFSGADVCMKDLVVNDAGDIYVAGSIRENSPDDVDAFVARLTPAGGVVWMHQFGSDSKDEALALDLSATGVVVGGYTNFELPGKTSNGGRDFFVVSYSADGELRASKQLGTHARDALSDVVVSNGTVYVTGISEGNVPGSEEEDSEEIAFVVRLDDELEPVWWWSAAASPVYREDGGGPVATLRDEGLVLAYIEGGDEMTVLLELNPDGGVAWRRYIGTRKLDKVNDLLVLPGYDVFVLGETHGAFPGYQEPICGFLIEGLSRYTDAFLLRADPEGKTVAAIQFGSVKSDTGFSLAAGPGQLYVVYRETGDDYNQSPVFYLASFDLQKL